MYIIRCHVMLFHSYHISSRIEHDLKKHLTDIHESVRLANEKMIREKTNLGAVQGQVKIYKEQVANMDKQVR